VKKIKEFNYDIKQIRSFLEVLNEDSFTRASRKLRVGQATVSHHIGQLEKVLGVKLIDRTAHGITVTGEGKIFRAYCENVFRDIETLKEEMTAGAPAGLTTVAASTIPSAYLLPEVLADAKKKFPGIAYRLAVADSREAVEMVKEGGAEAGVVGTEYRHPSLVFTPVCRDEIVLIAPRGFPARAKVRDLVSMPFIIREQGSGTRRACEEALAGHGIVPSALQTVMECSTTEAIKESVAAGLGVSFISRLAIAREVKARALHVMDIEGLTIERSFFFVHSGVRRLQRPAALLLELLIESYSPGGSKS
jgi:LysR family transcriptional regulator, low CO2-responsive transcriptional regulator